MRCYTFLRGHLEDGIAVTYHEALGTPIVFLGEAGRGRKAVIIPVLGLPGEATQMYDAKLEHLSAGVLALRAIDPDGSANILVRVCTQAVYTRGASGWWEAIRGNPETLALGRGAHGDAGRCGSWDDGLVVLHPGDVLKVKPDGAWKTKTYVIEHTTDSPKLYVLQDYELVCALREHNRQ